MQPSEKNTQVQWHKRCNFSLSSQFHSSLNSIFFTLICQNSSKVSISPITTPNQGGVHHLDKGKMHYAEKSLYQNISPSREIFSLLRQVFLHIVGIFKCMNLQMNLQIHIWHMGQIGGRRYIDPTACGIAAGARSLHKLFAYILSCFDSLISHNRLALYCYKEACHGDQRRGLI